jgi:hypothetical protein
MHRPRFPRPFRLLTVRAAHAGAAFTLVFALIAGLACDENAPTETRAAAAPAGLDTGGEDPDLALGDITAMGTIPLPINQTVATTPPNPAFRIGQTGTGPNGIFQISNSSNNRPAVQGLTSGVGRAGYFQTTNTANTQPALQGQSNGAGFAVEGLATGTGGAGLFQLTSTSNANPALKATTLGPGPAAQFESSNASPQVATLEVSSNAGRGRGLRVLNSAQGQAALIINTNSTNSEPALWVRSDASSAFALFVTGHSDFRGNVDINGTLTKDAGAFKIDHPLDPEHKYLSHSFIESPDMMNVYNGNVTLDANGRATVDLPDYFEALNRDFRYQLTAIGAPGPNLYIAEGVTQNRFRIAGGRPYARVSWMVTGVRQDTYANEHRIKVEEEKPAQKEKPKGERLVARR